MLKDNTKILLGYLNTAGFKLKRFSEDSDGSISFAESSYEDLCRFSKILRNKGFDTYEKVNSIYNDVREHRISNSKYSISFKTDTQYNRSFICLVNI